jgi:hypothetical protein
VNVRLQTSSRSARRQPPAQQVRQLGDVTGEARGHPYVSFAPDQINAHVRRGIIGGTLDCAHSQAYDRRKKYEHRVVVLKCVKRTL